MSTSGPADGVLGDDALANQPVATSLSSWASMARSSSSSSFWTR